MRLRCPACGVSPIFIPWKRMRTLRDWFTPLDGCPRCGYPYEREPGYYLISIWAINYGVGSIVGLAIYGLLEWKFDLPVWQLLAAVLVRFFSSVSSLRVTPKRCFLRSIFFSILMRKRVATMGETFLPRHACQRETLHQKSPCRLAIPQTWCDKARPNMRSLRFLTAFLFCCATLHAEPLDEIGRSVDDSVIPGSEIRFKVALRREGQREGG